MKKNVMREVAMTDSDAIGALNNNLVLLFGATFQLKGEIHAMRRVLDLAISGHPEPERLHALWQRNLLGLTDELSADETDAGMHEREGWKRVLAHYSDYFARLAR